MMGAIAAGGKIVLMHKWDAERALQLIEEEKITFTGGVPTIAWQLVDHPARECYDLSSLVSVGYGGATSAPDLVRIIYQHLGAMPETRRAPICTPVNNCHMVFRLLTLKNTIS